MRFFKGVLVFFLILIIVGGLGYIGYNTYINYSGYNASNTTDVNGHQTSQQKDTDKNKVQNHSGTQDSGSSHQNANTVGLYQANIILQYKESLNKSLTTLNEAIRLMTVDPYAPGSNSKGMADMPMQESTQSGTVSDQQENTQADSTAQAQGGNSTIINIYPQNGTSPSEQANASNQNNMTMQNMGTLYDANKMEQLHNGLYKMSLGMALLNQLQNQLANQADSASIGTQDLVAYYTNQYNLTVQNKSKLTQALNYINEAANLVNINPYVSSDGLVYDKERMNQIHQSVFKLAEGVASLNLIADDFTRQSVALSSTVQSYIYNNTLNNQMNHTTASSGMFEGLFDNVSVQTIVNVILVIFIMGLIFGILGFVFSLFKPAKKNEVF